MNFKNIEEPMLIFKRKKDVYKVIKFITEKAG
jgi:hypothetical protein